MLKIINENVIEGVVPPSDCEKNLGVKWLTGTPTGSFYIGDKDEEKQMIRNFLEGKKRCKVDSKSFFTYLDEIDEIIKKFKHMFYGPLDVLLKNRTHFESLSEDDRYIYISYTYPDRYLKTSKFDPNVREFKHSLAANITNVRFEKSPEGEYTVFVNLVENWREVIMARAPKCNNESLTIIFNDFIKDGLEEGKNKVDLARIFGIKYANLIKNNSIDIEEVLNSSIYSEDNLLEYVNNGILLSTDIIWESKHDEENDTPIDNNQVNYDNAPREKGGTNIILYGVPGAGKSWTIKNEYCKNPDLMERLVFHPDYTYSDFVGQILPKIDDEGNVNYEFTPGPFTKLVKKAYQNPGKMFYLVIEEINRGNAPAIFGDVFQLLDRNKDGASEYEITNADIAKIIYGDENHKVSIPSNMCILCTMNTSDQNVFTLDTAFQRRWSMRLIKNKFDESIASEKVFASTKILDTDVTWSKFFTEINKIILDKNIKMTSSEDKRLGTHFVNEEDLVFNNEVDENGNMTLKARMQNSRFPEKVLKYLWDDAFKFTKEDVFDTSRFKSLEDVIEHFITNTGNDRFKVFKDNIFNAIATTDNN